MDYLTEGIAWSIVQKMMIDAPSYDYDDDGEGVIRLSEDNGEDIMNYVNSLM